MDFYMMTRQTMSLFCGRLDFLGKHWREFRYTPWVIETLDGKHFIYSCEILAIRYPYEAAEIERSKLCMEFRQQERFLPHPQETAKA